MKWPTKAYYWPYYDKYPFILCSISKGLEKVFSTILIFLYSCKMKPMTPLKRIMVEKVSRWIEKKFLQKGLLLLFYGHYLLRPKMHDYNVGNKMPYKNHFRLWNVFLNVYHFLKKPIYDLYNNFMNEILRIKILEKYSLTCLKFVDALNCCHIIWFTQEDWLTCWQICFYALLCWIKSFLHNWIVAKILFRFIFLPQ